MEENEVREVGRDQIQVLCEWDAAAAAGDDDNDAAGEDDRDADGEDGHDADGEDADADAEDNHGEAIWTF